MDDPIKQHLESRWKVSSTLHPWTPGPRKPHGRGVLVFPPNPIHHFWTYAADGMSSIDEKNPLELFLVSREAADSQLELLSAVVAYHQQEQPLGIGHTVNFGRPWLPGSLCTYGLVSRPYLDGPELEWLERSGKSRIQFGWLIPITTAERDYKSKHGIEALEKHFEKGLDYLEPRRQSVIQSDEANK
jgi:hypothetical protein